MELYIFKIQDENKYVRVIPKPLNVRRTKNINDASWWMSKSVAKSWEGSIKTKFPSAEIIPVDMTLKEIQFNKIK